MFTLSIVKFLAAECRLQNSGELSVGWMSEAWEYAQSRYPSLPDTDDILHLGLLVEPEENRRGFRIVPVQVGLDLLNNQQLIPRQIDNLVKALPDIEADAFFYEFEKIHPFGDGNGRVGACLYNWLSGTLYDPVWPPNFFNDHRRFEGYGEGRPQ